jgi:hypothetical protein
MKKIFSLILILHVIISIFFFKKIIQSDIGLIVYFIVTMALLYFVFKQKGDKKDEL